MITVVAFYINYTYLIQDEVMHPNRRRVGSDSQGKQVSMYCCVWGKH